MLTMSMRLRNIRVLNAPTSLPYVQQFLQYSSSGGATAQLRPSKFLNWLRGDGSGHALSSDSSTSTADVHADPNGTSSSSCSDQASTPASSSMHDSASSSQPSVSPTAPCKGKTRRGIYRLDKSQARQQEAPSSSSHSSSSAINVSLFPDVMLAFAKLKHTHHRLFFLMADYIKPNMLHGYSPTRLAAIAEAAVDLEAVEPPLCSALLHTVSGSLGNDFPSLTTVIWAVTKVRLFAKPDAKRLENALKSWCAAASMWLRNVQPLHGKPQASGRRGLWEEESRMLARILSTVHSIVTTQYRLVIEQDAVRLMIPGPEASTKIDNHRRVVPAASAGPSGKAGTGAARDRTKEFDEMYQACLSPNPVSSRNQPRLSSDVELLQRLMRVLHEAEPHARARMHLMSGEQAQEVQFVLDVLADALEAWRSDNGIAS